MENNSAVETKYEARRISRARAEYLMGALGIMGGTLVSGMGIERRTVVQPVGSGIADGPVVSAEQLAAEIANAERFFGDVGADLAAFSAARSFFPLFT